MKNKASIIVLLVELIAIVVFHTAKASRPAAGIEATIQPPQQNHYSLADKPQVSYTNLK